MTARRRHLLPPSLRESINVKCSFGDKTPGDPEGFPRGLMQRPGANSGRKCGTLSGEHHRLAANQAGEVLESRGHPLAAERRAFAAKPQHELVLFDMERCLRQHARL